MKDGKYKILFSDGEEVGSYIISNNIIVEANGMAKGALAGAIGTPITPSVELILVRLNSGYFHVKKISA
jgi:hypothetical protein